MRDKSSPTLNTSEIKYQKFTYSKHKRVVQFCWTNKSIIMPIKCTKYILLLCQLKCTKYILDTLKKHTEQTQLLAIWFNSGFTT